MTVDMPTVEPSFADRALTRMGEAGPLCLGLDPAPELLRRWDLPDTPEGLRRCCEVVLSAVPDAVAMVKPQAAYFERFGAPGVAVLADVLGALRELGVLSVLDAKRGDIGPTMAAYAQAYLGPQAPLRADALTLSPYLGFESLRPAIDLATASGSGVFVLGLTSNPEGAQVQHVGEPPVAQRIAEAAARENAGHHPAGPVGLVVGATVGSAPSRLGIDLAAVGGLLLAPGLGTQGATPADLATTFGAARGSVIPVAARSLLAAGPDRQRLRDACAALNQECATMLGD